jgi:hypothetical protein
MVKAKSRYFFKVRNETEVLAVYRLVEDDENQRIHELLWGKNSWESTDTLIKMLISGEMDLEEVTEAVVRYVTPYVDCSEFEA